ncbi:unnamed protein product [Acanthosepion pharaonis]|uniref:DUF7789 domain-containing protein n=1 Tax=Acanthosepion pharaonis TaxID=158019 RepID=A0A812C3D3_ACAPH|nr:unnamed protein product [Sepia pharaonis]
MADISPSADSTSSVDYDHYGIVSTSRSTISLGFDRAYTLVGLTNTEYLFLGISILNIFAVLGLTIYQLVNVIEVKNYFEIIFTVLIIFNAACCLFYTIHGLLQERPYELYALISTLIIILLHFIVQFAVTTDHSPVKLARLIAACIFVPLNLFLMVLVVQNFGWLELKIVGASEALQQMYRQTTKFSTLLKFDFQITMSFAILFMKLKFDQSLTFTKAELIIISLAVAFSMAWDMLGYVMMWKEVTIGAFVFLFSGMVKPGFYLYKIITLYQVLPLSSTKSSLYIIYTMLTAAAVALIVWLFLMVEFYFVYQNFGKGLREHVFLIETKSSWRRLPSDNTQPT